MANGWAALASAVTAGVSSAPYHVGLAPNPPTSTLAPFLFDTVDADNLPVSAEHAAQVPSLSRAVSIIAGTVGSFPLEEWRNGARVRPTRPLLVQPDPGTTRQVTVTRTVEDLALHGVAWWLVLDRDASTGKPKNVAHVDAGLVTLDDMRRPTMGGRVLARRDVIRFDHDRYGILHRAARVLRTALALEQAAHRYARTPSPRTILRGNGDVQLTHEERTALVDEYEALARRRSAAYLDHVDVEQVGWSSSELQLTEARQYTAAQVALACNLDPIWCGANQPGSSLTYTNRQDLYRSLVDVTLRPYLSTIEQRLTGDDVTEHGRTVRFDLDAFLRGNAGERADLVTKLLAADVLTRDEARAIADVYPPEEITPP